MDVVPIVNGASTVAQVTKAPMPKSPFVYPDLCGRHRLQVEVQMMDREIGFLEEELNSLNVFQPASRCCEEVNASVESKPDPLLPVNQKTPRSTCLCRCIKGILCLNLSWLCCFRKCTPKCRKPKCRRCCSGLCCSYDQTKCSCCKSCCSFPRFSCSGCSGYSCGCVLSCHNCKDSCFCPRCSGPCCMCRCLCP